MTRRTAQGQASLWPIPAPKVPYRIARLRMTTVGGWPVVVSGNLTVIAGKILAVHKSRLPVWVRDSDGVVVEFRYSPDGWWYVVDGTPGLIASGGSGELWWHTVVRLLNQYATTSHASLEGKAA
jgi:hypothetical protein